MSGVLLHNECKHVDDKMMLNYFQMGSLRVIIFKLVLFIILDTITYIFLS
jgi:hypothetical protein